MEMKHTISRVAAIKTWSIDQREWLTGHRKLLLYELCDNLGDENREIGHIRSKICSDARLEFLYYLVKNLFGENKNFLQPPKTRETRMKSFSDQWKFLWPKWKLLYQITSSLTTSKIWAISLKLLYKMSDLRGWCNFSFNITPFSMSRRNNFPETDSFETVSIDDHDFQCQSRIWILIFRDHISLLIAKWSEIGIFHNYNILRLN
jgi:hypothetical protein